MMITAKTITAANIKAPALSGSGNNRKGEAYVKR